jgi:hypothetical protein
MPSNNPETIDLDEQSLKPDELSMETLKHELGLKKRPNWLLVKMMNALEQKRQKKGFGWSRAWNKYGMNTFRAHICNPAADADYIKPGEDFLRACCKGLEGKYADFIEDLLADPKRMVFTFYHNADYDGDQYEGVTFSFGRKVVDDRTKRDRVDIVLEDRRVDGSVDSKVDRLRVYVCPWATYEAKEFHLHEEAPVGGGENSPTQALYDHLVDYYDQWKTDDERLWSHWSVRYIDYFGGRSFIPKGSSFK